MRRGWAAAVALLTLLAAGPAAAAAGAVPATDPVELGSGYVLDQAGVLSGADETAAQQRLEQLRSQTDLDLWVVFVDDFTNPSSSEQWANQVATDNGLGPTQYLLAVAVEGRQFYLSGDSAGPVTEEQLGTIEQQMIQPQLAAQNWLGAVDAAANGLADAASGGSGSGTGGDAGGGVVTVVVLVLVVLVVIGIVIWLIARSRRRARVGAAATPVEQLSTKDLERQAGSALVEMDDAIKTSEEELGFARAQFGDAATTEFEAALETAKGNLDQAFHLKQKLDDTTADTEAEVRDWNAQIVQLCRDASALLDAKAEAFDELRKLEQNAPEALARVQELRAGVPQRIEQAEASLAALGARYAPTALATIADNADQARQRLAFADEQLAAAQQAIGAGKGGEAAVGIRAAEEAVDQASLLSDAVGKLGDDLAKAETSIKELVANLQQDVAAASAMPDADGRLAPVIASTQQAIASATAAAAGSQLAPLQVLKSLDAANTQIDTLVAGVRDQQEAARRAEQQLGQLVMQAQAQVSAAEDYITARRGAVGAEARTRLAEAGASLVQARQLQPSDPQRALAYAQRANQLAGQAIQLAQNDVGAFSGGGMFGGGGGGGGGGGNILGAVLGGIVINSMLGGGGRSSGGGMFGGGRGGGFGGGFGGGGRSSGSFGGGGTRGRRGGGRF